MNLMHIYMIRFTISITALLLISVTYVNAQSPNSDAPKTVGSNYAHLPNTIIKGDNDSLVVHVKGSGDIPVIMIPGHMQDESIYDNFIERNIDAAKFHVVIPPGMGGTPAYTWPEKSEEFISRPWTKKFEHELSEYIDNKVSKKPFLIVNWYTGLGVALHLANTYPDKLAGIVIVGRTGQAPYYRWYRVNPVKSGGVYEIKKQREAVTSFLDFWRNVDEYTWHSNMFSPSFYTQNPLIGTKIVYREAMQPVPISLRYFVEYLMDDLSDEIKNIDVPVTIISSISSVDQYNERLEGTPSEGKAETILAALRKSTTMDWQVEKDNITHTFFEGGGMFVWIDHPEEFDRVFLEFISEK